MQLIIPEQKLRFVDTNPPQVENFLTAPVKLEDILTQEGINQIRGMLHVSAVRFLVQKFPALPIVQARNIVNAIQG